MSILARDPVTGALTLIESALPRDVALDLGAGAYEVLPVGDVIGSVNVLDVAFATAPLVSGSATAGATLTVSGTATAAVAYEYQWLADGVLIPGATSDTYATDATLDLGKTFTGQMRAQDARGRWTAYAASSNSITIPAATYTIPDGEWDSIEDPDDAETRQTYVTATPTVAVPSGKKLRWYKGTTNPTDNSMFVFLTDMTGTGPYIGDSVGAALVGQTIYSRIATTNLDNTGQEWVTSIKSYVTSNVPSAPGTFTATNSTTVTGRVSLDPNNTAPAANGRPILEYGYSQNGGAITAFASGGSATTARDVDFAGIDPIAVRLHARNVNGWSAGSASVSVTPPVITAGVNITPPYIESTLYGGATYDAGPGAWANGDVPPMTLEVSDDGTTGWQLAIQGINFASAGTLPTTIGGDVKASLQVGTPAASNSLTYTAKGTGTAGNAVTVAYVNPGTNNASLSIGVVSNAITVNLATGPTGTVTTTAAAARTAIIASSPANALVTVTLRDTTGSGVLPAMAATNLSGGLNQLFASVAVDGKYFRIKATPTTGTPAYSTVWLMKPSHSHVLSTNNKYTYTVDPSTFITRTLSTTGFWLSAKVYYNPANDNFYIGGFGNLGSGNYVGLAIESMLGANASINTFVGLPALEDTSLRWLQLTWHIQYLGGKLVFRIWRDDEYATAETTRAVPSLSAWTAFRLGARPTGSGDSATERPYCDILWGTGDPALLHEWQYNGGLMQCGIEYDDGADAAIEIEGHRANYRAGSATYNISQVPDTIGSLDTFTTTATPTWNALVPGFIQRMGPPSAAPLIYLANAFGTTEETFSFESGAPGAVNRNLITINTLTHTGFGVGDPRCPAGSTSLGDISGTVANGVFTCTTPGILTWSATYNGTTVSYLDATSNLPGGIIMPTAAPPIPTQQRYKTNADGNGLCAMIEPYPTPAEAGTTFANLAALKAAIDALPSGGTLIVNDCDFRGQGALALTTKDYGTAINLATATAQVLATVVAKNPEGIKVDSVTISGSNLTLRGFDCTNGITGAPTNLWIDHCRGTRYDLRQNSPSATAWIKVTNWMSVEDGRATYTLVSGYNWAILQRNVLANDNGISVGDVFRYISCNFLFFDRIIISNPDGRLNNGGSEAHIDASQGFGNGTLGHMRGYYKNSMIMTAPGTSYSMQAFFHTDHSPRDFFFKNCITQSTSSHGITIATAFQNVRVEDCFVTANIEVTGGANSGLVKNSIGPNATQTTGASVTYSGNVGGVTLSSIYPRINSDRGSWLAFSTIATGYETVGPWKVIGEWNAAYAG